MTRLVVAGLSEAWLQQALTARDTFF